MKILLLNGPPRSGKDTIAQILQKRASSSIHLEKFALPIKTCVPLAFSIDRETWNNELDTASNKDLPNDLFYGETPRDVQISFSEDWLKPLCGKDIFGKLALRRLEWICTRGFGTVIFSDSGFAPEAQVLIDRFGAEAIQLWRINREGCNYKGDSRGYINLDGVRTYDVPNNGSLNDLRDLIEPLFDAFTLPREQIEDPNTQSEMLPLETEDEWIARCVAAEQRAFREWPGRKIARIEREKNEQD